VLKRKEEAVLTIGNRIKKLRKRHNLTQEELGVKVNVSSQVISNWERGYTNPDHDDVYRLAESLDVRTDYLHKGEEDSAKQPTKNDRLMYYNKDELDPEDQELMDQTYEFLRKKRKKQREAEEKRKKEKGE
jgi:transcriptional regulator with XRE-family HTH domain